MIARSSSINAIRNVVRLGASRSNNNSRGVATSTSTILLRSSLIDFSGKNVVPDMSLLSTSHFNTKTTVTRNIVKCSFSSAATTDLISILEREYAEEIENNNTAMPDALKELKDNIEKANWKIVDNSDSGMIRLYKTLDNAGGQRVQLSFHCQDTIEQYDQAEGGVEEVYDEDEEVAPSVRFTVTVTKAGKTTVFNCISDDGIRVRIEGVAVTTQNPESLTNTNLFDSSIYQGPEFHELAEDLQDSFYTYLTDSIGITTDITSFIVMYSDYKEQNQYVKFLQDIKSILG